MGNLGIIHVNYVGWCAILLVVWGVVKTPKARSWIRRSSVFTVLSLGPTLSWNRWPVQIFGVSLFLPLAILYVIPYSPFAMVHHPYRMMAALLPLLAVALGWGLSVCPKWFPLAFFPLMIAENLLLSPAQWPLANTPVATINLPQEEGFVVDWPPNMTAGNRSYQLAQLYHQKPIAAGINQFLSTRLLQDPLVSRLLQKLKPLHRHTRNRDVMVPQQYIQKPQTKRSELYEMGFRWFVLHRALLSQKEFEQTRNILLSLYGSPIQETSEQVVFSVTSQL